MLLEVSSKRLNYELNICGKYTIISGDSGSGKTTLFNLVSDYGLGNKSIKIICDREVVALNNNFIEEELERYRNFVIVIDEYNLLLNEMMLPVYLRVPITILL